MARAARLKLHGVNVEKLADYLRENNLNHQLFSVSKRREALRKAEAIPEDFAEEAYEIALDAAALAAFQLIETELEGSRRTAGLFGDVIVTETARDEDGNEVTTQVHGLKHIIHGMTREEFDAFESRRAGEIKVQGRSLNAKRMLRNEHAENLGEEPGELPFPEFEAEDTDT